MDLLERRIREAADEVERALDRRASDLEAMAERLTRDRQFLRWADTSLGSAADTLRRLAADLRAEGEAASAKLVPRVAVVSSVDEEHAGKVVALRRGEGA